MTARERFHLTAYRVMAHGFPPDARSAELVTEQIRQDIARLADETDPEVVAERAELEAWLEEVTR